MTNLFSVFPKRRAAAFTAIFSALGLLVRSVGGGDMKRVLALLAAVSQLMGAFIGDTPVRPYQDPIDMSRFELCWSDEFDNGFDTAVWQGHYVYGANDTQLRDTAYWNRDQVRFTDDGCLQIVTEYKENGPKGPGYYSYGMETNPNKNYSGDHTGYEQRYGYFETRCILPKGAGLNPAFWLLTDGMWDDDTDGGVTGAEIDVFETPTDYDVKGKYFGSVYHTVHVDAYGDAHKKEIQGWFYANDPYEEFNTYGVEWNEEGYTFYINGIPTAHTDFGGVCRVPLYIILSVGVDENVAKNEFLPAAFTVDYVRCYRYK